jgi:hypothetical protein
MNHPRLSLPLLLVLSVASAATADEPRPAGQGGRVTVLRQRVTGVVHYRGHDVRYIVADVRPPIGEESSSGGSTLFIVPVADFARDAEGRPVLLVSDPETGGDFRLPGASGAASAHDVARAVWDRQLDPSAAVLATFTVVFQGDLEMKKAVLDGALVQLSKRVESRDSAYAEPGRSGDFERAEKSVGLLPAIKVRIECLTPGMEDIAVEVDGHPTLSREMRFQARVPARFIGFALGKGGLAMTARYSYEAIDVGGARVSARRVARDFVNLLLKEKGLGRAEQGPGDNFTMLVTRDEVNRLSRSSDWKDSLVVEVDDEDDARVLFDLFQKNDSDLFAVRADEVDSWLKENFRVRELLNDPNFIERLKKAASDESLSQADYDYFKSELEAKSSAGSGGGGVSILGIVGVGGGGGSSDASAKGTKTSDRKAFQNFLRHLASVDVSGKISIFPSVDYALVSTARLEGSLATRLEIRRRGPVTTVQLSSPFNSMAPTLRGEQSSIPSGWKEEKARLELRERAAHKAEEAAKDAGSTLSDAVVDRKESPR